MSKNRLNKTTFRLDCTLHVIAYKRKSEGIAKLCNPRKDKRPKNEKREKRCKKVSNYFPSKTACETKMMNREP